MKTSRKTTITIDNREYNLEFPSVGEYIEIETLKTDISLGKFAQLLSSRTVSSLRAIQIVEIVAILTVLCPQLIEDLKVKSILDLDIQDFIKIMKSYQKDVAPWYKDWFEEFNNILEDTNKEIKEVKSTKKEK